MSTPPPTAPTAASFVNGLGVNTRLGYGDTAYANPQTVLNDVAYLGVTKVRDAAPSLDGASLSPYAQLAARGISFDVGVPSGGAVDINAFVSQLKGFAAQLPGALASIEGPNETNVWPVTFRGLTGMPAAAAVQQALYTAVKNDSQLAALPVYCTTLGGASQDLYAQLGNLSGSTDFGNAHVYPQGGASPADYLAANIPWQTPDTPGKATVLAEGGYFTMPGVADWEGVNQDVQARYTLDYVLDAAAQGVPATYLYELLDERSDPGNTDREQHFGLFNTDGTPKPAATALHDLTTLLADPGDQASTGIGTGVAYTVSNLPASGHTLELAKASGASDVIVWAEPSLWNQQAASPSAAPTTIVTVNLDAFVQTIQVFDPLLGTKPIAQLSNVNAVSLSVTDHPLIVEVAPNAAAPAIKPATTAASPASANPDTLTLHVSEEAWKGDAQFTLSVDGRKVSGPTAVTTLHSSGRVQDFNFAASLAAGPHTIGVSFVNDAYGGTPATDRNLYVGGIDVNGSPVVTGTTALMTNGTHQFHIATPA